MVSSKNAKKAKKPLETTLGKAPPKPKEKDADISHLRRPIETSVFGVKQLLAVWETATNEVKNILTFECDIMYECRICRTIFRSLANFILHKRSYCKGNVSATDNLKGGHSFKMHADTPKGGTVSSPLKKVIEKLHEIERVRDSAKNYLTVDLTRENDNEPIKTMDGCEKRANKFDKMVLEKIDGNDSGIFQTLLDKSDSECSPNYKGKTLMKDEVMEIHKKIEDDVPVLDQEGKICGFTSSKRHQSRLFPKSDFKCPECNNKFVTRKSLSNHVKYVHNPSRIVYVCPTCKDTLANPWCVYRHLLRVHRMTNKQVRRMREQVHNSWIRRGDEGSLQKKKPESIPNTEDSENQWINDIEGDKDFQMCAGCGKHFERKAALHSHSQLCSKRLEICNNIKENFKKKGEEDNKKSDNEMMALKGASKRKGKTICDYRKKINNFPENNETKNQSYVANDVDSINNKLDVRSPDNINILVNKNTDLNTEPTKQEAHKTQTLTQTDPKVSLDSLTSIQQREESDLNEKANGEPSSDNSFCGASSTNEEYFKGKESHSNKYVPLRTKNGRFRRKNSRNESIASELSNSSNACPAETTNQLDLIVDIAKISSGPSSSCEIISRSNSTEDIVLLSSDEDSKPASELFFKEIPIESKTLKESGPQVTDSVASGISVCEISDSSFSNQGVVESDIFSDKISFEAFCEKVGVNSRQEDCKNIDNSFMAKRKRKVDELEESNDFPGNKMNSSEDDVIFVSETKKSSDSLTGVNKGFPGFSNEETNNPSFSIDFSNLSSVNNSTISKRRNSQGKSEDDTSKDQFEIDNICIKNESLPQEISKELNFIPRAAPYMDQEKLSCIPCGMNFNSFNLLIWHMSAHFSWFRYQCSKCSFIAFERNDCMCHIQTYHKLKQSLAANYILPLPNWKTVLMSHEFRLIKDCNDLKGKHTDEKIGIEESSDQNIKSTTPFCLESTLLDSGITEKYNNKEHSTMFKGIDVPDNTKDFHQLPEPLELGMPVDVSEIFNSVVFEEKPLLPDENIETMDHFADESNDDWGLSNVCNIEESVKDIKIEKDLKVETSKGETSPINNRPCRVRTKVKQSDDFVYYDFSNIATVKSKVSTPKVVPIVQRKKS